MKTILILVGPLPYLVLNGYCVALTRGCCRWHQWLRAAEARN